MGYRLGKSITKLFIWTPFGWDRYPAEGLLVKLRGNTFSVCGKGQTPYGVYTKGSYRKIRLLSGEKVEITIPEGVITRGDALVNTRTNDRKNL